MRAAINKVKPSKGVAHALHLALVLVLPVLIFVLVRKDFAQLAFIAVILSKWRILAVRPRFWAANIRANSIDLMVGLSIVVFMTHTGSILVQLAWAAAYSIWLLFIKPGKSTTMVSLQAFIGQLASLSALYKVWQMAQLLGWYF